MSLTLGSAPEDLRVLLPYGAVFVSRIRLTVTDEATPDWSEFTLRLEIGALTLTAEMIEDDDDFARFEFTVDEADADYEWWSRDARLEVERSGVVSLVAHGVAEVTGR